VVVEDEGVALDDGATDESDDGGVVVVVLLLGGVVVELCDVGAPLFGVGCCGDGAAVVVVGSGVPGS
jgi:hypothetical protein